MHCNAFAAGGSSGAHALAGAANGTVQGQGASVGPQQQPGEQLQMKTLRPLQPPEVLRVRTVKWGAAAGEGWPPRLLLVSKKGGKRRIKAVSLLLGGCEWVEQEVSAACVHGGWHGSR